MKYIKHQALIDALCWARKIKKGKREKDKEKKEKKVMLVHR